MNGPRIFITIVALAVSCAFQIPAAAQVHADHQVFATNDGDNGENINTHFYDPEEIVIRAGETVRWSNNGNHPYNVVADDGSFCCANGCMHEGGSCLSSNTWTFTLTFDEPGIIPYHDTFHADRGMTGVVIVLPANDDDDHDPEPGVDLNFGMTGSWYNPATDGQGFLIDVIPGVEPPQLVVYWFTYDLLPGGPEAQRWYIAQGAYEGNSATLDVFMVTGGAFDLPNPVNLDTIGSAVLEFESCTMGTLSYDIDPDNDPANQVSGVIPIIRLSPDVLCEDLSAAAE